MSLNFNFNCTYNLIKIDITHHRWKSPSLKKTHEKATISEYLYTSGSEQEFQSQNLEKQDKFSLSPTLPQFFLLPFLYSFVHSQKSQIILILM